MTESNIKFVGLHAHSGFSIFDGLGNPDEHIDFAIENGMNALALTDHGQMNGLPFQVDKAKKLKKQGVDFKPIYGVEAYFVESIDAWKKEYADYKSKNKSKKKEENALVIEDEQASKKAERNILNRRAHLVVLAQNQKGLNNLFELVSKSYSSDSFYRYPRIDLNMLKEHNEGLIISTACLGGPLAKIYWQNREKGDDVVLEKMVETIRKFTAIFGDRFYCELQWNGYKEQHEVNKFIIKAAQQENVELISTADSHYARPELFKDRELYKQLGWLGKKGDKDDQTLPSSREDLKCELYPKNGDQMWSDYKRYSSQCGFTYDDDLVLKSIEKTHEIAFNQIEDFYPDNEVKLPSFVVPENQTADEALWDMCLVGLKERGFEGNSVYEQRLREEFEVIKERGFSKYFLTMKAIADEAMKHQLTGAGRGSAAGSLLAYALKITAVDPIKYDLQFSRFLRKDAKDWPDIDYDVSEPMELKELLIEKWGRDSVVPISNFNTLQLRSLIKDISKFYGLDFAEVNKVTSVMLKEATPIAKKKHGITAGVYAPTFEEVKEYSTTLKAFLNKYPHVATHIDVLYGERRSISRHAGGVLIADSLSKHMPLISSGGVTQTPWTEGQTHRHLEPLGFIKFDILGLASLRMVEGCIRHILIRHKGIPNPTFEDIKRYYDENLDPNVLNLDDQKVYKNVFHKGNFPGIFQFTERGAQAFCKKAKPQSIIDISAVTSIFRPGPLSAKVHEKYVNAKNNPQSIRYPHPIIKDVTEKTYGFLVFQEQIAMLAHKLGKDISLDEGNILRKVLTKKGSGKGHEVKDSIHQRFVEGCVEKGLTEEAAEEIWKTFEYFAAYGFNAAHAVCYSILSYQCAYLFTYFPSEWMAAFLDKEPETRKEKAINIARSLGFTIKRPDINESGFIWMIKENDTLVQPLTSIKGLGDKAVEQIVNNRPFNTIEDLIFNDEISYSKLNKKSLDVLCRSGTLNSLMDDRFAGMKHFWSVVAVNRPKTKKKFNELVELYRPEGDFTKLEKITYTTALTGVYPISDIVSDKSLEVLSKMNVKPIGEYDRRTKLCWFVTRDVSTKKTKKGKPYYIVKVVDLDSNLNTLKCWGINPDVDQIYLNSLYMGELDYNETWGFSVRSMSKIKRLQ